MKKSVVCSVLMFLAFPFALQAQTSPATSYIVIFRPNRRIGSLGKFPVTIDGRRAAKLANGSYFKLDVVSGEHILTVNPNRPPLRISVSPGDTAYIRARVVMAGFFKRAQMRLMLSDQREEKSALPKLKPLQKKFIY